MNRVDKKAFRRNVDSKPRDTFRTSLKVEDVENWYNSPDVTASVFIGSRHRPESPWMVGVGVWSFDDFGVNKWFAAESFEDAARIHDEQVAYVSGYLAELQPLSLDFLRDEGFKVD